MSAPPDAKVEEGAPRGRTTGRIIRSPAMMDLHDPAEREMARAKIAEARSMSEVVSYPCDSDTDFSSFTLTTDRPCTYVNTGGPSTSTQSQASIQATCGSSPAINTRPAHEDWPFTSFIDGRSGQRRITSDTGVQTLTSYTGDPNNDQNWQEISLHDDDATVFGSYYSTKPNAQGISGAFGKARTTRERDPRPSLDLDTGSSTVNQDNTGISIANHDINHKFPFLLIPIDQAQRQSDRFNTEHLPEMDPEQIVRPRNPTPLGFSSVLHVQRGRKRTITFSDDDDVQLRGRSNTADSHLLSTDSPTNGVVDADHQVPGRGGRRQTRRPSPYPRDSSFYRTAYPHPNPPQAAHLRHHRSDYESTSSRVGRHISSSLDGLFDLEAARGRRTSLSRGRRICSTRNILWVTCGLLLLGYWVAMAFTLNSGGGDADKN